MKESKLIRIHRNGITVSIHIIEGQIYQIALALEKKRIYTCPAEYQYIVDQFSGYLNGKNIKFQLPLHLDILTTFQKKVFSRLQKVPFGKTISYEELARLTATVNHRRAVAMALSKNPFPIVIPCHRVVPKYFNADNIGGFSAGVEIKRKLLLLEATDRMS